MFADSYNPSKDQNQAQYIKLYYGVALSYIYICIHMYIVWQVRDEFREDYDEGRGGLGKKHQERMDRGFDARRRY